MSDFNQEDLRALVASIDALRETVTANKEQTRLENEKRDHRIRWSHRAIVFAIGCAVIGVLVGTAGVLVGANASDAVAQQKQDRAEARTIVCRKENETAAKINRLNGTIQGVFQLILLPDPDHPRTAEEQQEIVEYVHARLGEFKAAEVAMRDCSPKAIERYYTSTTVPRP